MNNNKEKNMTDTPFVDRLVRRIERLERDLMQNTTRLCALEDARPQPEPEPEWRRWVNEVRKLRSAYRPWSVPLTDVLHHLALLTIHEDAERFTAAASIVAICEDEVCGDWKADSRGWLPGAATVEILVSKVMLSDGYRGFVPNWRGLGNAAAAFLRDDLAKDAS